jgi:dienelactone hydrolase
MEPVEGGLPVVIFNPGWNQPKATYLGYATQLAQWGYIAVIRSHPSLGIWFIGNDMMQRHVAEQSAILDWLAEENGDPGSPVYGMVDADNAGVMGQSFGNGPTINAAVAEPRIRAAVTLDATHVSWEQDWRGIAERDVAFLYIGAGEGGWCSQPIAGGERLLDVTNPPAMELTIVGADHVDFMEDMYGLVFLGQTFCSLGSADSQDVRDIATRYLIPWFNVHLKGLTEFEAYYHGTFSEEDEADGLVHLEYRL